MDAGEALQWIGPEGFAVWVGPEALEPTRWRIGAADLASSVSLQYGHGVKQNVCQAAQSFPERQRLLAAGVVQSSAHGDTIGPRSIVLTLSAAPVAPCGAENSTGLHPNSRESDSPRRGAAAHVWAVDVRRCLPRDGTPSTRGGHTHGPAQGSDLEAAHQLAKVSLTEVARLHLPHVVWPASSSASHNPRAGHPSTASTADGNAVTTGAGTASGATKCVLASEGAWAALQIAPTNVLLLGFGAALAATRRPAMSIGGAGAAAGGTASPSAPHHAALGSLRCLDMDLSVAAPRGVRVLACCASAGRVVLDAAVLGIDGERTSSGRVAAAGAFAAVTAATAVAALDGGSGSGAGPHLLLRVILPLEPPSGSVRIEGGVAGDGDAQGRVLPGTRKAAVVPSAAGHTAAGAVTACVRFQELVTAICPLLRLTPGSRKTQSHLAAPAAVAASVPPALVGGGRGGLALLVQRPATALGASDPAAPLRKPGGQPASAATPSGLQEPPVVFGVATQLGMPGPVESIHALPAIRLGRCSNIAGSDEGNHDSHPVDTDGGYVQARGAGLFALPASRSAFAAVLCRDAAQSLTVLRVRRLSGEPVHPQPAGVPPVPAAAPVGSCGGREAGRAPTGSEPCCWSLQQLLTVRGVQDLLPVPLPSALSLALGPPSMADRTDGTAPSTRRGSGAGGRFEPESATAWASPGEPVLASVAAVAVLYDPDRLPEQRRGHGCQHGDSDVEMHDGREDDDSEMLAEEEKVAGWDADGNPSEDEWGDLYTQRPTGRRQRQRRQQREQRQSPPQQAQVDGLLAGGRSAGLRGKDIRGAAVALGPLSLGPWSSALVLPADVQPLQPQSLLPAAAGSCTAAQVGAAANAPPFAAGVVTRVAFPGGGAEELQRQEEPQGQRQPQGRHQQQGWGHPPGWAQQQQPDVNMWANGGTGPGSGGGDEPTAQEAGMAKMLAHMARRWDTGVQHALEQRATLGRMLHLTQEAEQLIAASGRRPLPTHGSAGVRPPSRAALLDPLLDLEAQLMRLPPPQQCQDPAVGGRPGDTASAAGGGGGGPAVAAVPEVDCLLDQLLGAGPAGLPRDGVAVVTGSITAGTGRPGTGSAGKVTTAAGTVRAGKADAGRRTPQSPGGESWCLALESLVQSRQGADWVLQVVIRLDSSWEEGAAGPSSAGDMGAPARPPPPPVQSLPALELDDVALLLFCTDGLPLANVRARWTVVQRAQRRVAVEAAVPLTDLLGRAPMTSDRRGAGAEGDAVWRRQRDLHVALGPLPGLFDSSGDPASDDDPDTDWSSDSGDTGSVDDGTDGGTAPRPADTDGDVGGAGAGSVGGWGPPLELQLGAVVRVTARIPGRRVAPGVVPACGCGGRGRGEADRDVRGGGGGAAGGPWPGVCPSCGRCDSDGLQLQVRTLDLGPLRVRLDALLGASGAAQGAATLPQKQQTQQQQQQQQTRYPRTAEVNHHAAAPSPPRPPPGALLRPSRSLLLVALTGREAEATGLQEEEEVAAGSYRGMDGAGRGRPCPSAAWGHEDGGRTRTGERDAGDSGGNFCRDLKAQLLSTAGFGAYGDRPSAGDSSSGSESAAAGVELVWQGPMGWRCAVSLRPYGVYGCEVELSYLGDAAGGAGDGWSGAALDQVHWAVTQAAEGWCAQAGRQLATLGPNPLADSELDRLDVAAGALQRCVDATLELFEQTLLAQQHQQRQRKQGLAPRDPEREPPSKQQPHQQATAVTGVAEGQLGGRRGSVAMVKDGGAQLQAMMQEVLQLRLQLNTAVEMCLGCS